MSEQHSATWNSSIYNALYGLNESYIRVLYYNASYHWVETPFQIDEKGWIFTWQDHGDSMSRDPFLNWTHTFVSYNGSSDYEQSYAGDTQVPFHLDYDDEICFYAQNGRRVTSQTWWNYEQFPYRLEINVTDPIDGGVSFMYIYFNNETPQGTPTYQSYVNWNPSTMTISTEIYEKRFKSSDPDITDVMRVIAPGSDGKNSLEEADKAFAGAHIRIEFLFGPYEDDFDLMCHGTWGGSYYDDSATGIDNVNEEAVQLSSPDPGDTPGWTGWDTAGDKLAVRNGPIRVILTKQNCSAIVTGHCLCKNTDEEMVEITNFTNNISLPIIHPLVGINSDEINKKCKDIGLKV